jgi:hypothetical protein
VIPLVRVLKLLSVATLFTGTVGAFVARDITDRQRFAYALAGPGFGLSWALGFALAGLEELPVLSTWVMSAMALSLLSLQVVLYAVGRDGRRTPLAAALAIAPLAATIALMVYRPA